MSKTLFSSRFFLSRKQIVHTKKKCAVCTSFLHTEKNLYNLDKFFFCSKNFCRINMELHNLWILLSFWKNAWNFVMNEKQIVFINAMKSWNVTWILKMQIFSWCTTFAGVLKSQKHYVLTGSSKSRDVAPAIELLR